MTPPLSIDHPVGLDAAPVPNTQPDHERALIRFAALNLFTLIYFQKFALFSPDFTLSIPMLVMFASVIWLVVSRDLNVVAHRLAIFLIFFGVCLLSESFNRGSETSIGQVILLYVCMTVCARVSAEAYRNIVNRFIMYMILPACIVLVQYFYQKATGLSDPINLERFFPKSVLMLGFYYNAHYPWYSTFSRPNGFFFLEPSFVSAFLASAAILEISYFRRRWCVLLLVGSTLFTLGATGISMLVMAAPFLLLKEKPQVIVAIVILAILVLMTAYLLGIPLPVVSRVDEFNDPTSSSTDRMASSASEFVTWLLDPFRNFFGYGAGSSPPGQIWPLLKLLREYGPLSMFAFLALYVSGLVRRGNLALTFALTIVFNFTGGYLLSPIMVELIIIFCFILSPNQEVAAAYRLQPPGNRLPRSPDRRRLASQPDAAPGGFDAASAIGFTSEGRTTGSRTGRKMFGAESDAQPDHGAVEEGQADVGVETWPSRRRDRDGRDGAKF